MSMSMTTLFPEKGRKPRGNENIEKTTSDVPAFRVNIAELHLLPSPHPRPLIPMHFIHQCINTINAISTLIDP